MYNCSHERDWFKINENVFENKINFKTMILEAKHDNDNTNVNVVVLKWYNQILCFKYLLIFLQYQGWFQKPSLVYNLNILELLVFYPVLSFSCHAGIDWSYNFKNAQNTKKIIKI